MFFSVYPIKGLIVDRNLVVNDFGLSDYDPIHEKNSEDNQRVKWKMKHESSSIIE